MNIPGKLVVRTYAPVRRWLMALATLLLVVVAAYLTFELGRKLAGFDGIEAARQRAELRTEIDRLQDQQRELRVQLAAADEMRAAQVRERTEVARTIGELQEQLARAQQDLQFYRGIANPQAAQGIVIRVQQFQIAVRDVAARQYTLRFTLNRESRTEELVAGNLGVTVDGMRQGAGVSFDLAAVSDAGLKQAPFSFRYYASMELPLTLPVDFKPERVTVEVRSNRKGAAPYRQTFVWNPES